MLTADVHIEEVDEFYLELGWSLIEMSSYWMYEFGPCFGECPVCSYRKSVNTPNCNYRLVSVTGCSINK